MTAAGLARALPLFFAASLAIPSAERWQWNSWERTRTGIERLRRGDAAGASAAFDTAARVGGGNPRALLNAGAAHLLANDPAGALPWLEQAAQVAPAPLAASAQYHLGTARLMANAGGTTGTTIHSATLAGAVEALQEALRLQPDFPEAKHNLELALRAQERQRQQQQEQERQRQSQATAENRQKPSPQERSKNEEDPSGQSEKRPSEQPRFQAQDGKTPEQQARPGLSPTQTRLTPEQVASLLASVENLERQERRQRSLRKLSRQASVEKDW